MSGRDWRKAKKLPPREDFRGVNVELANGSRTPTVKKDTLAKRAEREMRKWIAASPYERRDFGE